MKKGMWVVVLAVAGILYVANKKKNQMQGMLQKRNEEMQNVVAGARG